MYSVRLDSFSHIKEVFESNALRLRRNKLAGEALDFSRATSGNIKIIYDTDHTIGKCVISKIREVTNDFLILDDYCIIPKRAIRLIDFLAD